jgi:hypothetical protein
MEFKTAGGNRKNRAGGGCVRVRLLHDSAPHHGCHRAALLRIGRGRIRGELEVKRKGRLTKLRKARKIG